MSFHGEPKADLICSFSIVVDMHVRKRCCAYKDPLTLFPLSLRPPLIAEVDNYSFLLLNDKVVLFWMDSNPPYQFFVQSVALYSGNDMRMFCIVAFEVFCS